MLYEYTNRYMNYVLVCPIGVVGGKEDLLTYKSTTKLAIGTLVEVPFGTRKNLVWYSTTPSSLRLKQSLL